MTRHHWTILAVLAVFVVPFVFAWGLRSVDYRPAIDVGGVLYASPRPAPERLRLFDSSGERFAISNTGKWIVLQSVASVCDDGCLDRIRLLQAVRVRLHKHAWRVLHVGWRQTPSGALPADLALTAVRTPELEKMRRWLHNPEQPDASIWIIDPRGFAVMSYAAPLQPQQILSDLKTLISARH